MLGVQIIRAFESIARATLLATAAGVALKGALSIPVVILLVTKPGRTTRIEPPLEDIS